MSILFSNSRNMAKLPVAPPTNGDFDAIDAMIPAELAAKEESLVRKIDLRLMPCLILMIILKYVHIMPKSCKC